MLVVSALVAGAFILWVSWGSHFWSPPLSGLITRPKVGNAPTLE